MTMCRHALFDRNFLCFKWLFLLLLSLSTGQWSVVCGEILADLSQWQPSSLPALATVLLLYITLHHTQYLDSFHSSCCTARVSPGRLGGVHTNNTQPAHAGQSRLTQAATSITRTSRHVGLSQNILLVIWVCHKVYCLSYGFATEYIACHMGLSLNILLVIWGCQLGLSLNISLVIWVFHRICCLSTEYIACYLGCHRIIFLVIWVCQGIYCLSSGFDTE